MKTIARSLKYFKKTNKRIDEAIFSMEIVSLTKLN